MSRIELAIKFGSNEVSVYRKGFGIMARRAGYVATLKSRPNGKICAYGLEAKHLCELKPNQYVLHQAIQGIDIINSKYAEALLNNLVEQTLFEGGAISAIVAVPCALTEKKLLEIKILLHKVGISKITFVQNATCIRTILQGLDDTDETMIVDIGKYLMDISVLNRYTFISGRDYLIGGALMDDALKTYIEDNYGVEVTIEQAETIKDEVASLYQNDMYTHTFTGIVGDEYKEVTIRANEARVAVVGVYDKMCELIEEFMETLPPNTSAQVRKNGIIFTGGASSISGFTEYAIKRLNIPVRVLDNPKDAVILGAGKLLSLDKSDYPYINV